MAWPSAGVAKKTEKRKNTIIEAEVRDRQDVGQACMMSEGKEGVRCWHGGEADANNDVGDEKGLLYLSLFAALFFRPYCGSVQLRFFPRFFFVLRQREDSYPLYIAVLGRVTSQINRCLIAAGAARVKLKLRSSRSSSAVVDQNIYT